MSDKTSVGKTDLIDALAKKTGDSKAKCGEHLNALLDVIQSSVAKGHDVAITGFGTFSARKRAARNGRNPATGAAMKIAASVAPAFKAGATFKAAVAKKKK